MKIPDNPESGMDPATEATLNHIAKLWEREEKLTQMRTEAEQQMLHRLGVAIQDGSITIEQLYAAYGRYSALKIPGRSKRWDAHISIPWIRLSQVRRRLPNEPNGTWSGEWPPDASSPVPIRGISVVYVLFDPGNEPCYVGSTKQFRTRLKRHARDGKVFTRWQAYGCRDRAHAYEVEDRVLKQHMPRMNRRAGR